MSRVEQVLFALTVVCFTGFFAALIWASLIWLGLLAG